VSNALKQLELKKLENVKLEHKYWARKNILAFTKYTMPDYYINWHHRILCNYLDRFVDGEIKRLMVFMPPRHGKSELVSRRLPAFIFGKNPDAKIIASSYAADLARMMNRDTQRIIDSEEYQELFPKSKLFGKNIRTVGGGTWLRNSDLFEIVDHRGFYRACGVGGGITGMGAEYAIIDDPIKNYQEAESAVYREALWEWYRSTLLTRLEKNDHILITLTRWQDDDLAGRLLKLQKNDSGSDKWVILSLPAIKENNNNCDDPREIGDALWPWKYDEKRLKNIQNSIGSYLWSALFQQSPTPRGGTLFKSINFRYYTFEALTNTYLCYRQNIEEPIGIRKNELIRHVYVDPAIEIKKENDPSGMQAWGYSRKYKVWLLLDRVSDRIEHTSLEQYIKNFAFKNQCIKIGIENEKLGKVLVKQSAGNDTVMGKKIPFEEIPTGGLDKYTRAVPMATYVDNERVFFPREAPWLAKYEGYLTRFPRVDHDEDIDCTSMAQNMENKFSVTEALRGK